MRFISMKGISLWKEMGTRLLQPQWLGTNQSQILSLKLVRIVLNHRRLISNLKGVVREMQWRLGLVMIYLVKMDRGLRW
jgi:hypothetical protein